MKEVYLLFTGDLDNGHYDALFSLEDKKTGIFLHTNFIKNISIPALLANIH
jgi:hypothetical protein